MYNTLGFDPLEDNYDGKSISDLSAQVKQHFEETEKESIKIKYNLFGNQTKVSVKIDGVPNEAMQAQMKAQLVAMLARNQIVNDDVNGLPLTFSLKRNTNLAIEKASWDIQLRDKTGKVQSAAYSTKMPEKSRNSVVEATLIAAATSQINTMKTSFRI